MENGRIFTSCQLKTARALSDWSQNDLARATNLSLATIRKLELGHRPDTPARSSCEQSRSTLATLIWQALIVFRLFVFIKAIHFRFQRLEKSFPHYRPEAYQLFVSEEGKFQQELYGIYTLNSDFLFFAPFVAKDTASISKTSENTRCFQAWKYIQFN